MISPPPLRAFVAAALLTSGAGVLACAGDEAPDDGGASSGDGGDDAASTLPSLCSGCPSERPGDGAAHFHHVHLNTNDLADSQEYYERMLAATRVRLNDRANVVKANGALILLDVVPDPLSTSLDTGIEHIGWGSTDVLDWFAGARGKGIDVDDRSGAPAEPLELFPGFHFVYVVGPANERIEVNTFPTDEFSHVHFMTDDVDTTVAFYEELLGVTANGPQATMMTVGPISWTANTIVVDHVNMIFFGPPFPVPTAFAQTDDRPIGHIAFAFEELGPVLERAALMGARPLAEPSEVADLGFRSAFVRAPNEVLIEIVEAGSIPNP